MGVISVRLADGDERYLRKIQVNISEVVRQAVHKEVQRLRAEDQVKFLRSVSERPEEPAEREIRRLRDARRVRP